MLTKMMLISASNRANNRINYVIVSLKCKKLFETEDPFDKLEVEKIDVNYKDNGFHTYGLLVLKIPAC